MQTVERWATRSDAWTPDDDKRLADLVLQHIRTGSTQLRAFDQAANELGRTPAACGYRWNGVVRKSFRDAIEAAKRDRKSLQRVGPAKSQETTATSITSSDSMRDVIKFLQTYDEQYQKLRQQVDALAAERQQLSQKVQELEKQVTTAPQFAQAQVTPEQLEEDSKALFAIIERARKLLEGDSRHQAD